MKEIGSEVNKVFYGVFYGVRSDGTGDYANTEQDLLSNPDFVIRSRFGYVKIESDSVKYDYHLEIYSKNGKRNKIYCDIDGLDNVYIGKNGWIFGLSRHYAEMKLPDYCKVCYNVIIMDKLKLKKCYVDRVQIDVKDLGLLDNAPLYSSFEFFCKQMISFINKFEAQGITSWKEVEDIFPDDYTQFIVDNNNHAFESRTLFATIKSLLV